ncbi:MAG: DUF1365 domain-containing protein [Planctomycetaceae bacterium]
MNSCLYAGEVLHCRRRPIEHRFRYGLFLMYLDLDELPELFDRRWFWSARRLAPAWFRRKDYLGDPAQPLADAVRGLVEQRLGRRPAGAIRVLTHLRYFGYVFNPVSFYYCFDERGALDAVVAEITNTPWKQRHAYVLDAREGRRFRFDKQFHVSPFFGMDYVYDWRVGEPAERLRVRMDNRRPDGSHFHATLALRRKPITGRTLAWALLRHPFMTLRVSFAIYLQAVRLWWKRAPFHVHPDKRAKAAGVAR